jgi:uncharacterized membrane protein YfcA
VYNPAMENYQSVVALALILCLGTSIQSAAGFAAGLVIIPALLWSGYGIPAAQCAVMVATFPQNAWGVWALRDSIPFRQAIGFGIVRILFLPLGVWGVWTIDALPTETIRQIVGGVVLIVTLSIMVVRPQPRPRVHPCWAALAFPLSGLLQGLVGMGGPPMVFWIQAHDWSDRRMRGFLFAVFLIGSLPSITLLYLVFGDRIVGPGLLTAALIPVLLVATYAGMRVGNWLGRDRLRSVTLWLLILMGLSGLAAPWMSR